MKRFIISESEKNRILNMHKARTKRHYINEALNLGNSFTLTIDNSNLQLNALDKGGSFGANPAYKMEATFNGDSNTGEYKIQNVVFRNPTKPETDVTTAGLVSPITVNVNDAKSFDKLSKAQIKKEVLEPIVTKAVAASGENLAVDALVTSINIGNLGEALKEALENYIRWSTDVAP